MNDPSHAVLANVRALRSEIGKRAVAIEAERSVPADLMERLRAFGVFRMLTPQSHGGLEVAFPLALDVIAELAAADGSVGWTVMIGSATPLFLAGLPRATFDAIYAETPDVILAGSTVPAGTADPAPGGYRVTGRWPFASGCLHADWMFGHCKVSGSDPTRAPAETAEMRMIFHPAGAWRIEDTWRVSGLKGTGSHHIALTDCFVPEAFTCPWPPLETGVQAPLFMGMPAFIPLMHAALAVGIAEGARGDLLDMVVSGRRQLRAATSMADSPIFHYAFAEADADVNAARGYLHRRAGEVWTLALDGRLSSARHGPGSQQAGVWITATCARAVDSFYTLAGGAALYDASPLQRRLRDMRAATQHVIVQPRWYEAAGRERIQSG